MYKNVLKCTKFSQKKTTDIVNKIAQLMILYKEPLSRILTAESGKPLAEARVEIIYASNFFKYFAEEGRRLYGDIIPPLKKHQQIFVTKEAIGVCGIITPWNFPSAMITRKLAPLLVVGCSAVIKPASETPLSALAIAQICMEAGVIPGVINVITSSVENSKMVGREICSNKIVRKLSFTGSTATGMNLAAQCTSTLKRMSLELGGNAPFIVFKDADIDEAVRGAYVSKFRNSGQTCVCTNRFFVQREIYDEFVEKFHGFVRREINFERNIGHGFAVDESEHGFCSKMGPLIDMKGVLKVEQHLKNSVSDGNGGEIVFGGKRMTVQHLESETFFEPTIVANVDVGNMQCLSVSNEETFGPLAIMIAFDDEQQVIQMANETDYGLCAYFYTKDMNRVFRMSEQLEYGMVGVNTGMISREIAPFGGVKFSGMGREGSKYGLDEYINIKYTCIESS